MRCRRTPDECSREGGRQLADTGLQLELRALLPLVMLKTVEVATAGAVQGCVHLQSANDWLVQHLQRTLKSDARARALARVCALPG